MQRILFINMAKDIVWNASLAIEWQQSGHFLLIPPCDDPDAVKADHVYTHVKFAGHIAPLDCDTRISAKYTIEENFSYRSAYVVDASKPWNKIPMWSFFGSMDTIESNVPAIEYKPDGGKTDAIEQPGPLSIEDKPVVNEADDTPGAGANLVEVTSSSSSLGNTSLAPPSIVGAGEEPAGVNGGGGDGNGTTTDSDGQADVTPVKLVPLPGMKIAKPEMRSSKKQSAAQAIQERKKRGQGFVEAKKD